ncbi:Alpha/Beta hydrolase protein [Fimicolochytrium jonesii]|uniref:Alpha/Beta hydrolase protein n=1 Tax=Fimicolochytrium jonesii TaxID=1396493 RepID=UPI0022FE33B7|nr:Alpha/Beta hydrolase protein [Fimicolochytrium jonesii]KAI8817708.1 Alpha/Beta hydrolase protein [Fimicolochytrium jonesii]
MDAFFDPNPMLLHGLATAWCLECPEANPNWSESDGYNSSSDEDSTEDAKTRPGLPRNSSRLSLRSLVGGSSSASASLTSSSSTSLIPSLPSFPSLDFPKAVLHTTWNELAVLTAFGSHQVKTLAGGILEVAKTGAAKPSWNTALHLGVYLLRSNFAFHGISIPRLRLWSGRMGAAGTTRGLPSGVALKEVSFIVNRDELLTFEDNGAEWREGKQAGAYPTVLPENETKWNEAARQYELKGEWLAVENEKPEEFSGGISGWLGSWFSDENADYQPQPELPKLRNKVIYYLHGGAYIGGTNQLYRILTGRLAKEANCKLFAVEYRLAPENPFPASLHDAFAGYLYLINPHHAAFKHLNPTHEPVNPADIVLMGDSAGGGLVMCLLNYLNLYLRSPSGEHLVPLPSGATLMSPWVDLAFTSESWLTNASFDWLPSNARQIHDHIVPGLPHPVYMYLYGEDSIKSATELVNFYPSAKHLHSDSPSASSDAEAAKSFIRDKVEQFTRHPLVSPIFAESLAGLPPILVQAGEAEVLRDDSLALAYKYDRDNVGREGAHGWVRHEMFTDMVHVWIMMGWLKESTSAMARINRFLDELEVGHPLEPILVDNGVLIDSHASL